MLDAGLLLPIGTSAVTIGFGMLITFDTAPYDWRSSWWIVPQSWFRKLSGCRLLQSE